MAIYIWLLVEASRRGVPAEVVIQEYYDRQWEARRSALNFWAC